MKFDPKVEKVYKAVGKLLAKYRSGKVPKALKIMPHLQVCLSPPSVADPQYLLHLDSHS